MDFPPVTDVLYAFALKRIDRESEKARHASFTV
jgi:hypothetical protein